jgi:Fe-Mn family superoxide dismutase
MKSFIAAFFFLFAAFSVAAQPFVLPTLPFKYDQYAPQIDAKTMEIHLTKHHQAYVNNLNKAIVGTSFEKLSLEDLMFEASETNTVIRNNAGGHYNHSLFWEILAPTANQGTPSPLLQAAIVSSFGTMDSLKKLVFQAASSRFGSGWAWIFVNGNGKLEVCSTPNQDNPLMSFCEKRGVPIVGIDVWEHAYYLNYQNKRQDYLNAVWTLLDWKVISEKFGNLKNSDLNLKIAKDWVELRKVRQQVLQMNMEDVERLKSDALQLSVLVEKLQKTPLLLTQPEIAEKRSALIAHCLVFQKFSVENKKPKILATHLEAIKKEVEDLWLLCQKR